MENPSKIEAFNQNFGECLVETLGQKYSFDSGYVRRKTDIGWDGVVLSYNTAHLPHMNVHFKVYISYNEISKLENTLFPDGDSSDHFFAQNACNISDVSHFHYSSMSSISRYLRYRMIRKTMIPKWHLDKGGAALAKRYGLFIQNFLSDFIAPLSSIVKCRDWLSDHPK
jgi:hypothetical protein